MVSEHVHSATAVANGGFVLTKQIMHSPNKIEALVKNYQMGKRPLFPPIPVLPYPTPLFSPTPVPPVLPYNCSPCSLLPLFPLFSPTPVPLYPCSPLTRALFLYTHSTMSLRLSKLNRQLI